MSSGSELVFLRDPLSPVALLLCALAVITMGLYGMTYLRLAGRPKGLVLLGLRGLALLTFGVILLQPSLLSVVPIELPLPAGFTTKEITVFSRPEAQALLPPPAAFEPPVPPVSDNVSVEAVVPPPFAYLKSRGTVSLVVLNDAAEQDAEVVLARLAAAGPKEQFRKRIHLLAGRQEVLVPLMPEELGTTAWRVSLEHAAHDADPDDGFAVFGITTGRDVVRTLHIAGHPSWDVLFLRRFLTALPGLELVSFYLLVEAEDFYPHSKEELALIPFPTEELFVQEVGNFDLIIVQNFPLGTYFQLTEKHQKRLAQYVQEGGALLLLGGDRAFSLGGVDRTPLAQVVPNEMQPFGPEPEYIEGAFLPELTPEGATHPVTSWAAAADPGSLLDLPPLAGLNRLGEVRPGGIVLASAVAGDQRHPLIVAGAFGKGRVLAVATDSLWKWAFPRSPSVPSAEAYRKLLLSALAWLTQDPKVAELTIAAGPQPKVAGKEAAADVCLAGMPEKAARTAHVSADWVDARGAAPALHVALDLPFPAASPCVPFMLPPARPGAWLLSVRVEQEGMTLAGQAVFPVERARPSRSQEVRTRAADLLNRLFYPLLSNPKFTWTLDPDSVTVDKPVVTPLWDSPVLFFLLLGALLAEWGLRRRWGFL